MTTRVAPSSTLGFSRSNGISSTSLLRSTAECGAVPEVEKANEQIEGSSTSFEGTRAKISSKITF